MKAHARRVNKVDYGGVEGFSRHSNSMIYARTGNLQGKLASWPVYLTGRAPLNHAIGFLIPRSVQLPIWMIVISKK
jgi:hypothetical protein